MTNETWNGSNVDGAIEFLRTLKPPYIIKTDGLATGKGVVVTDSFNEAVADVRAKLTGAPFGDTSRSVLIEGS